MFSEREVFLLRDQIAGNNLVRRIQNNEVSFPVHIGQLDTDLPRIEVVRANISDEAQNLTPKLRKGCGGDINKLKIFILGSGLWGNSDVVDGYTDDNFGKILHTYALISSQEYRSLHEKCLEDYELQKGSEKIIRETNGRRNVFISDNLDSLLEGLKKELEKVLTSF